MINSAMKYAFVCTLLFVGTFASIVPTVALNSLSQKFSALTKTAPVKSTNEDIKFCGTYVGKCESSDYVSTKSSMTILGMMHRNPIYLEYPNEVFMGQTCEEQTSMMKVTMSSPMQVKNGETKDVVLTPEKFTLVFKNEAVTTALKCTTPIELNVEYDVTTLDCKDEQGEDPFATYKEMIGQEIDAPMEFGEDRVVLKESNDDTVLERESDIGCTCATKTAINNLMSFIKTPAKPANEDVKFCGSYSAGCEDQTVFSVDKSMTILGMMHRNPIYLEYPVSLFGNDGCKDEDKLMKVTMSSPMQVKNGESKDVVLTPEKNTVIYYSEAAIAGLKCAAPLELNVEYDVTTLDCKDEQGEDPHASLKEVIGKEMQVPMVFGESDLIIKEDGGETKMTRESDIGCTCSKGLRM